MRTSLSLLWTDFSMPLLSVCCSSQQTGEKQCIFINELVFENNTPVNYTYQLTSTPDKFSVFTPPPVSVRSGDSVSIFLKFFSAVVKAHNGNKTYLYTCHKILDDNRLNQFNQQGKKNCQLIIDRVNAGILLHYKKGAPTAVSQKTTQISNTTPERLYQLTDIKPLWTTVRQMLPENSNPVLFENAPLRKALQSGQAQTEVLVVRFRNGEYRWLHFSAHPLFDEDNANAYSVVLNIVNVREE